jgi:hypothetical protein
MLEKMPLDPDDHAALEGGVEAMDNLIAKLRNVCRRRTGVRQLR